MAVSKQGAVIAAASEQGAGALGLLQAPSPAGLGTGHAASLDDSVVGGYLPVARARPPPVLRLAWPVLIHEFRALPRGCGDAEPGAHIVNTLVVVSASALVAVK